MDNDTYSLISFLRHRRLHATQNAFCSLLADFYVKTGSPYQNTSRHFELWGSYVQPLCNSEKLLDLTSDHVWEVLCGTRLLLELCQKLFLVIGPMPNNLQVSGLLRSWHNLAGPLGKRKIALPFP